MSGLNVGLRIKLKKTNKGLIRVKQITIVIIKMYLHTNIYLHTNNKHTGCPTKHDS